jgi:hypothetical protein
VQSPWFYHPPVSPYNAGEFSRRQFEEWNRSVGERVVITGWSADTLKAAAPEVFCLSDLEARDAIRLGDSAALEFVAALQSTYGAREDYEPPPTPFSWLAPGHRWAPPVWLYTQPTITVYYDRRI